MENQSLISAIAKASEMGNPKYYATEGKVESVNKLQKICKIKTNDFVYENAKWISPILPKKGAKCILVFRNNIQERATAFSFSELDEIQTTIGEFTDLEISDLSGVNLKHKNTEIKIDTSGNLTISNSGLEIKMDTITQKFVITGNVEFGISGLEKAILGETMKAKLEQILDAINLITVTCTAPGSPSGPPLNAASFTSIKTSLEEILSSKVKLS
jgi:hypothetical protein